jgi:predicted ATPase
MACLVGNVGFFNFRSERVSAAAYSDEPQTVVGKDGSQTPVVLAALKLADDEAFDRIEVAMRRLVPAIKRVRIKPAKVRHPAHQGEVVGSKLYFDFHGAQDVPAHHASHGTLIALALLTVLHSTNRPRQILLDDFDHALHPRAQMELVRMIKELLELDDFKETQIIATTHSPYVLDELAPENVIAFALREDGTVASKSLSEHPDVLKTKGALKSGELWSLDAERDWVL